MIVLFVNEKGGVGKSTLCISFACYLAKRGIDCWVYDTDPQQTLVTARQEDQAKEPSIPLPFEVSFSPITKLVDKLTLLKNDKRIYLLDLPGASLSSVSLNFIYEAKMIVVPFKYERFIMQSTEAIFNVLNDMRGNFPNTELTTMLVPNNINPSVGTKEEREKEWPQWRESLGPNAIFAPTIKDRSCMKRKSTLYMTKDEELLVKDSFDFMAEKGLKIIST